MKIKLFLTFIFVCLIAVAVSIAATRVNPPAFTRINVSTDGEEAIGQGGYSSGSFHLSVSEDGRYVTFDSGASNLVSNDTNNDTGFFEDVFVRDRLNNTTECVSVDMDGKPSGGLYPSISNDGRYVAFESFNVLFEKDVFVRDRSLGVTEKVSVNSDEVEGDCTSEFPSISGDGRFVAFSSCAGNLTPINTFAPTFQDIYVRDLQEGTTELVSVNPMGTIGGYADSYMPSITSDGRYVAFDSMAFNLLDPGATLSDYNPIDDIFVRDRTDAVTEMISVSSAGIPGDGSSNYPSISADGRYVAFESAATNLLDNTTATNIQIYVRDRSEKTTEIVSVSSDGAMGNMNSSKPSISSNGRFVGFSSDATNLVEADENSLRDVFIHDRQTKQTVCLTCGGTSITTLPISYYNAALPNGSIVFNSEREGLVLNDTNKESDIFMSNIIFRDFNYNLYYPAIIR